MHGFNRRSLDVGCLIVALLAAGCGSSTAPSSVDLTSKPPEAGRIEAGGPDRSVADAPGGARSDAAPRDAAAVETSAPDLAAADLVVSDPKAPDLKPPDLEAPDLSPPKAATSCALIAPSVSVSKMLVT